MMEGLEDLRDRRLGVVAAICLVVGVLVGWLVIGWNLLPVKWQDTDPQDLRWEHKLAYVAMVADSFDLNEDLALAEKRLKGFDKKELSDILGDPSLSGRGVDRGRMAKLAAALRLTAPAQPTKAPIAPAKAGASPLGKVLRLAGIILLAVLALVLGAALAARYGLLPRRARKEAEPQAEAPLPFQERYDFTGRTPEPPPGEFVTTYSLGDDGYDASFTIESPSGEFLGECGVGIADTLGQPPPERVTAFEVWLFDKNDVRTVTKVLHSEYAYHDDGLRSRLAAKGEPSLAEPGKPIVLETDSLRIEARVEEMAYGEVEELPSRSFFSRFTVELVPSVRRRSLAV